METEIKCPSCGITFTQKKSLYCHVRKFHDEKLVSHLLSAKDCICQFCDKKFLNKKSLDTHITKYHPGSVNINKLKRTRIICTYVTCRKELFTFSNLRHHLFEEHKVKVEYEIIEFCGIAGKYITLI
ncbi:zinc finger and BTB domain-containing protein 6-like [Aphis craccivora]|uniref:Zinc finger and BTB domain-containing protein 6-like n=1 Tax=Aphis craccivora TaxID=307492 RepID=A0A6G0VL80_APHCR|nr:zinc finger and BTB domain-containing protein 6-like [Aphis craccivora]